MKPIPVTVLGPIKFNDNVVIVLGEDGLFTATVDGGKVAESTSARRISEWARANGAKSVKHAYDLREEK